MNQPMSQSILRPEVRGGININMCLSIYQHSDTSIIMGLGPGSRYTPDSVSYDCVCALYKTHSLVIVQCDVHIYGTLFNGH